MLLVGRIFQKKQIHCVHINVTYTSSVMSFIYSYPYMGRWALAVIFPGGGGGAIFLDPHMLKYAYYLLCIQIHTYILTCIHTLMHTNTLCIQSPGLNPWRQNWKTLVKAFSY